MSSTRGLHVSVAPIFTLGSDIVAAGSPGLVHVRIIGDDLGVALAWLSELPCLSDAPAAARLDEQLQQPGGRPPALGLV